MKRIVATATVVSCLMMTGFSLHGQGQGGAAPRVVCVLEFGRCSAYGDADIEYGLQLYRAQCTGCHGTNGDGVPGVDLRSGQFRRSASDIELRGVIANGIANTPMPSHALTDAEFVALVAYLRNMRDAGVRPVALGDSANGQALFEGKGRCTTCHRVGDKGSRVAPDLTTVGTRRPAATLQQVLVDPTSAMLPSNRAIRAVTQDGKTIAGRRLNEDTYTVQIIDDREHLLSLDKAELREYTVLKESPMPSYADTLTVQERADLLAYLVSLKGLK
jgi:cytochrome c oxidase cbb3-type subunit III